MESEIDVLSNGDRDLAREIEHKVRHEPLHFDAWGDIPAIIALPNAAIFAGMAYWLRDYHELLWGGPLLIAGLLLAWHALWRDNGSSNNKGLNAVFLVAYSAIFVEAVRGLWERGFHYLAGLICLTGLVAINALLETLLRRAPNVRFRGTYGQQKEDGTA